MANFNEKQNKNITTYFTVEVLFSTESTICLFNWLTYVIVGHVGNTEISWQSSDQITNCI